MTPALANSKAKEIPPVDKIKASVLKRGVGEKSRVKVKRQDGTTLKGFISQAGEDSFVLTDSKTRQTTTLAYQDVTQVKGPGLSKGKKIAIGVGVGAAVAAVVIGVSISRAVDKLFDDFRPF